MDEKDIQRAWQQAIKPGEWVRHSADWRLGEYVGPSPHPMYDASVDWRDGEDNPLPCHLRNLYPAWWPTPEWAKPDHQICKR